MPLNKDDKQWIQGQVRDEVKLRISVQQRSRAIQVAYWLREWGVLGVCITAFLALIAICLTLAIFAFSGVKDNATFRGRTDVRLDKIEAALLELRAPQSPKAVLDDLSKLDKRQFANALPALRKVTEQPVAKVSPDQAVLRDVAFKLRETSENTPDYWTTVLRFIQFASNGMASNAPPPGSPINATIQNSYLTHQTFPEHSVFVLDGGGMEYTRFENSRIIFTNNPVRMRNVTFVNCAFEFPGIATPTPYLENAARQLLASNFEYVSSLPI